MKYDSTPDPELAELQQLLELERELAHAIARMRAAPAGANRKHFDLVIAATNRVYQGRQAADAVRKNGRPRKPRAWERHAARDGWSTT